MFNAHVIFELLRCYCFDNFRLHYMVMVPGSNHYAFCYFLKDIDLYNYVVDDIKIDYGSEIIYVYCSFFNEV